MTTGERETRHDHPPAALHGAIQTHWATGAAPLVIAYIALFSLLPARLVVPGLGGAGRPAGLFAIGLVVWWAMTLLLPASGRTRWVPLRTAVYLYLLAFFAAVAAGLDRGLPGVELRAMDRALLVALGFIGVIIVITDGVRSRADVERIVDWTVGLGAVGAMVGIIQFAGGPDLSQLTSVPGLVNHSEVQGFGVRGSGQFLRVRGFALHAIEFGVVLAALLPMAISRASAAATHPRLRYSAAATIAAGIPLAVSRSAVVGVVVGMAVYAIHWNWRERINALAVAFVGAMAFQAVTPGLLGTIRGLFVGASTDSSVTGRTEDFAATARYIDQRPWFGRGPGTFIPDRYRVLDNEYLGTVIDSGFVGLAALVLLLCTAGVTACRLYRSSASRADRSLAAALGAGVAVAVAVLATFDALAFPMYAGVIAIQIGCIGGLDALRHEADAGGRTHVAPSRSTSELGSNSHTG